MQLKPQEIDFIKKSFNNLEDKHDFLRLVNYVKALMFGRKVVLFELKHLTYHSNPKVNRNRYKTFEIKKKTGGVRIINAPNKGLKILQSCLSVILQSIYKVAPQANGFVLGKSIVDNAKIHTGNIYVYHIDLKDFFSSIDQARVWGRLKHPPFNLTGNKDKISIANIIAALSCHTSEVQRLNKNNEWFEIIKNVLPQGAPSSPVITNIICEKLDYYLAAVSRRFGLKYSRYADDITFSSMYNVFQSGSEFLLEVERIVTEQGFHIKTEKTRLQKEDYRQSVTGIVVNVHPNLPKRFISNLRQWMFYWESFGYDRANQYFRKKYKKEKIRIDGKNPQLGSVLEGKLNYIKMVKGSDDSVYISYRKRFDKLVEKRDEAITKDLKLSFNANSKHSPALTVKFLKYFKYDNESAFKQLVHKPIDLEGFDFGKILQRSSNDLQKLFINESSKLNLPTKVSSGVIDFLKKLDNVGMPFYKRTGDHPLEDRTAGLEIQKFKGNYRFGNERSESSILSELIKNVANKREFSDYKGGKVYSFGDTDTSGQFKTNQIKFLPDQVRFQTNANFFTWVPSVTLVLSTIFESILKHSNVNGSREFTNKQITVELKRRLIGESIGIDLIICDCGSLFNGDLTSMMTSMRREFLSILNGIADFRVRFTTIEGVIYECQVLPFKEDLQTVTEQNDGFTYMLTFYD